MYDLKPFQYFILCKAHKPKEEQSGDAHIRLEIGRILGIVLGIALEGEEYVETEMIHYAEIFFNEWAFWADDNGLERWRWRNKKHTWRIPGKRWRGFIFTWMLHHLASFTS